MRTPETTLFSLTLLQVSDLFYSCHSAPHTRVLTNIHRNECDIVLLAMLISCYDVVGLRVLQPSYLTMLVVNVDTFTFGPVDTFRDANMS